MQPGTAEASPGNITEVDGTDAHGNAYVAASELMEASLEYDGNSRFKLTISNTSGSTANPTPFSPGVWAISYIAGTDILNPNPLYEARSEEHTSELQSLMRISYAVFCLKKKIIIRDISQYGNHTYKDTQTEH